MVGERRLSFNSADAAALEREIATPTLGGVRSPVSTWPTVGMTPERLARILREAETGDTEAYFDMAEELEEKYPHYLGALGTRKRAVTQLPITVEAAGDDERSQKDADLLRTLYKSPAVQKALFDIMDALGKGLSYHEIVWNTKRMPWLPSKLVYAPQKWFELDRVDRETSRLKGGEDGMSAEASDLEPVRWLIHRHKSKSGLTIRGGLARTVCWAWLFQNFALKDWVVFAEIYGIPMRLGKYDNGATEADKRTLMRAVVGIANDTAGIIPKSMEVVFVNALASGNPEVFQKLCIYLDQQVSKAVLGQTGTTDATTGGFGSSGDVHNDVREDIQKADARNLADTLTDLGRLCIDFNHGPPPSGEYPSVQIGAEEFFTVEDMEKIEKYVDMGGNVESSVVGDKLGLPDAPEKTSDGKPVKLLRPKSSGAQNPAAQEPQGGPGAPKIAAAASFASEPFLNLLKSALKSESALSAASQGEPAPSSDAIDDMIDAIGGDDGSGWVEVMAPLIEPIEAELAASTSYDDFKDRLIGAFAKMDSKKLVERLSQAQFNARLAGEAAEAIHG